MALACDATRVTRDVDAPLVPHGVVVEETRMVADELGLPRCRGYWGPGGSSWHRAPHRDGLLDPLALRIIQISRGS